jgi:phosphohistidine phosphatase
MLKAYSGNPHLTMGKFVWRLRRIRGMARPTMLTLTLMRHAKSSWAESGLTDFARALAPRGVVAGPLIAAWLGAHVRRPDVVLVSAAVRTRATWAMLADAWRELPPCTFDDTLYMATAERLFHQIGETPSSSTHVMIVGHNPGLQDLALALTGGSCTAERIALLAKLPTAGVVVMTFDVHSWSEIRRGEGHLQHFVSPRRLAGASGG